MPNETSTLPPVLSPDPTSLVSDKPVTLSGLGWEVANFLTVMVITSGSIALVQNPLKTCMFNLINDGRCIPNAMVSGGFYAGVRALYAGVGSGFVGSGARTTYVATAKKGGSVPEAESGLEETAHDKPAVSATPYRKKYNVLPDLAYIAAISLGDVLVSQVPTTRSDLLKARVVPEGFQWRDPYNFFKVATLGLGARYTSALINFYSLCIGEQYIASLFPDASSPLTHTISGVLSGVVAAIPSTPINYAVDVIVAKSTVVGGKLHTPPLSSIFHNASDYAKKVGPKTAAKQVLVEGSKQVLLRAAKTGSTFGVVAGVGAALGARPLAKLEENSAMLYPRRPSMGFFDKKHDSAKSPFDVANAENCFVCPFS